MSVWCSTPGMDYHQDPVQTVWPAQLAEELCLPAPGNPLGDSAWTSHCSESCRDPLQSTLCPVTGGVLVRTLVSLGHKAAIAGGHRAHMHNTHAYLSLKLFISSCFPILTSVNRVLHLASQVFSVLLDCFNEEIPSTEQSQLSTFSHKRY